MKKLKLTQGKFALVDDEDFERVRAHKWYASFESRGTKWYAKRTTKKHEKTRWKTCKIRLGHFILDMTSREIQERFGFEYIIDHDDGNSLNYQKENLKIITQTENMEKSAGWKKKIETDGLLEALLSEDIKKPRFL